VLLQLLPGVGATDLHRLLLLQRAPCRGLVVWVLHLLLLLLVFSIFFSAGLVGGHVSSFLWWLLRHAVGRSPLAPPEPAKGQADNVVIVPLPGPLPVRPLHAYIDLFLISCF
jgi:hypothetical protein